MAEVETISWTGRGGDAALTCFIQAGDGDTVVLIHGVGMTHTFWRQQIDDLRRDYRVIAYDMLGHGGSSTPPANADLADYSAQLLALLDALGLDQVHLVGHSMGALVSLEFALTHPERLHSVAALNAVYCRTPDQRKAVEERAASLGSMENWSASIEHTLERWFGAPAPSYLAGVVDDVRASLERVDAAGYARSYRIFATSDTRHKGHLENLAIPALFMTGDGDQNSSPSMSIAMAACTPNGQCEIIAGERHMMSMTAPAKVDAKLRDFFSAVRCSGDESVTAGSPGLRI